MKKRELFAGIMAALASIAAQGQEAAKPKDQVSLNEIVVTGQRISLSATKTETSLIETPQSISVVTAEILALRNVQGIEEALRYTPGVTVDEFGFDPRYEQTSIRGFASTAFGDFRDGLKQVSGNGSYYRTEPYGLESIEIFRGPSSVLYGQNAPGGLVNFVTKKPQAGPVRDFQVDAGNNSRYSGRFDVGDSLASGSVDWRLTGLFRDSGTQIPHAPDDRSYIAPALLWRPGDNTSITFLGHYLDDTTTSTPNFVTVDGRPTDVYITDYNWDFFKQKQYQAGYLAEHRFSENLTFRQNFRYNKIDLFEHYQFIIGQDDVAQTVTRGRGQLDEKSTGYAVDNQLVLNFDTGALTHTLLGGIDYTTSEYDWAANLNLFDNTFSYVNPVYGLSYTLPPLFATSEQKQEQIGAYVQDQLRFGGFIATLGARYDDGNSDTSTTIIPFSLTFPTKVDDTAFTYRAGLTYLYESGLAPYVSYATSFQLTPGIDYFGSGFIPSEGDQAEVGLKYEPQAFPGFFTLSLFDLKQTNVLTTDQAHLGFQVQTGEIGVQGAEIEVSAHPIEGLNILASYTYLDSEITSNDPIDNGKASQLIPDHTVTLFGDYNVQSGSLSGLGFGAGLRYVGESFASTDNTLTNSGEFFVDAMMHYDLNKWRFSITANNLLNNETFKCSFGACAPGLDRTVIGSVRYRY